jgi:hypothetical protein
VADPTAQDMQTFLAQIAAAKASVATAQAAYTAAQSQLTTAQRALADLQAKARQQFADLTGATP